MPAFSYDKINPRVSVIITTMNRKDYILDCIRSLYDSGWSNFEIILVDNGSTDSTEEAVKEKYPQVKLICSPTNLGIAGGRNLGQRNASGEYLLFLDSDVIVDKDLIKNLVTFASNDLRTGIVVPKIFVYDIEKIVWYAGATVNLFTSRVVNIGAWQKDHGQFDKITETSHGPTAFMVRTDIAKQINGHDEIFFMSYADLDFALRVKKMGYKVFFYPYAILWHKVKPKIREGLRLLGYDRPMRAYYYSRNRVIFEKKNAGLVKFLIFIFLFFPLFNLWYIYKIIALGGGKQYLYAHLIGAWDGLKYVFRAEVKNRFL